MKCCRSRLPSIKDATDCLRASLQEDWAGQVQSYLYAEKFTFPCQYNAGKRNVVLVQPTTQPMPLLHLIWHNRMEMICRRAFHSLQLDLVEALRVHIALVTVSAGGGGEIPSNIFGHDFF